MKGVQGAADVVLEDHGQMIRQCLPCKNGVINFYIQKEVPGLLDGGQWGKAGREKTALA